MDDHLKTYFAPREKVPDAIRTQLHEKLQHRAKHDAHSRAPISIENLMAIIAPFALLLSVIIILLIGVVFGAWAFLLSSMFYIFSMMGGAAIILIMFKPQEGGVSI